MNSSFLVQDCKLLGLKIITPFYVEDDRGYFLKNFEKNIYKKMGLENDIAEDFESYSHKNVVRGLHFQTKNPQIKIVRAILGEVMDVVVDLRKDSPTFGQWERVILCSSIHNIFYIPAGFAHGFRVISKNALISYKCIGKYDDVTDSGIFWNDKELNIPWDIHEDNAIVSEKDSKLMNFKTYKESKFGLK